ncbi:MAG: hypothetical protein SGJ02_13565 [bacterium]|nr:hypothetical protein [bacterium]
MFSKNLDIELSSIEGFKRLVQEAPPALVAIVINSLGREEVADEIIDQILLPLARSKDRHAGRSSNAAHSKLKSWGLDYLI